MNGLNQILSTTWDSLEKAQTDRDKYQGLSLCMHAYSLRLELLSSAEPLKYVVSFVDSNNSRDTDQQNNESLDRRSSDRGRQ